MATSKKTHTTKKTIAKKSPVKKTTAKKSSKEVKARPQTWRFYVVTIGIFLVAVAAVVVIALFTSSIVEKNTNKARLERINDVYASLRLDDASYIQVDAKVFGDKRAHWWDKSKTEASSIEYLHGDTVSNTAADLDTRIKGAGFTLIQDDTSANGYFVRYHYKSADNEYVRLTVVSKQFLDASQNAVAMGESAVPAMESLDRNAGPAHVTLKVNLDDNNE